MSNPTSAQRLGAFLRSQRYAAGLTQTVLAERIGILQPRLARWESGRNAPTMAQVDDVLACLGLRLRLDVERRPDPQADWAREKQRLAALTPAERVEDAEVFGLAALVEGARTLGVEPRIDGQVAALIQGVPGRPQHLQVAVLPDEVLIWLNLTWLVRHAVDEDLMCIHDEKEYVAKDIVKSGGGLLNTKSAYVRLRVVDAEPETTRLRIQTASHACDDEDADVVDSDVVDSDVVDRYVVERDDVDADVVCLHVLPEHFREPSL